MGIDRSHLRTIIKIASHILAVAYHGDYSNGNIVQGVDEGTGRAMNYLREAERALYIGGLMGIGELMMGKEGEVGVLLEVEGDQASVVDTEGSVKTMPASYWEEVGENYTAVLGKYSGEQIHRMYDRFNWWQDAPKDVLARLKGKPVTDG